MRLKKNWKRIHSLVYLIAPLVVLHYAWGKKGDFFNFSGEVARPWAYAIALVILMTLRIPAVRRIVASIRTRVRVPFRRGNPA
jgi:sulfoxide reductase heme-binding subunit YedZ